MQFKQALLLERDECCLAERDEFQSPHLDKKGILLPRDIVG